MEKQKGFAFIPVIIAIFLVSVLGTVGAGVMALTGKAPTCASQGGAARSTKDIGDALEQGSVTITDSEATTLAQSFLGGKVEDARVCFSEGAGHVSGKINLGSVSPSFYISGGVDLTGAVPKATNLNVQLGSLPSMPGVSNIAAIILNKVIEENLNKVSLDQKYSAEFSQGSLTIRK